MNPVNAKPLNKNIATANAAIKIFKYILCMHASQYIEAGRMNWGSNTNSKE